ncbi:hypothetical protein Rumeso_02246 [Rubellimicrobium mesophilum DSM 19309]|uniref:N-acetyltransferase domain-containing protein n=1 Tax=Rubellimicrobium mesophilum DSM 19309 TaxID=442562 RepID=A0A017HP63_9RHOB|nr:hypothetical protein [Rubellimicrobium mesophilum]EYD76171.1 hypothetical protein Rumeso_02246 [Rubellimicrobium mesophilum DSM 19309]
MSKLLQKAIDNNVGLYRTILGHLGIGWHVEADLAHTGEKAPPYYSNAVTRSERWRPDDRFQRIAEAATTNSWADWSIKDSHDVLDLTPHGFRRLLRASWIHLDAAILPAASHDLRFELVAEEEGLALWRAAWDPNLPLGQLLFGPELLHDPDLAFVAGYDGDRLICGCLVNRTDDVLGISNCFALEEPRASWAAMVRFITDRLGRSSLVGYERDAALADFQSIGFEPIGSLPVWHRPAA